MTNEAKEQALSKDLLDILACPKCKQPVRQEDNTLVCTETGCGLVYPIRDGIPIMLIEEAVGKSSTA